MQEADFTAQLSAQRLILQSYLPSNELEDEPDAAVEPRSPPPPPRAEISGAEPWQAPANIRTVSTATALQQAVASGTQDIEITSHMDLRGLKILFNPYNSQQDALPEEEPNRPQSNFTHTMYTSQLTRSLRVRNIF